MDDEARMLLKKQEEGEDARRHALRVPVARWSQWWKGKGLRWCVGGREEAGKKGPDRIRRLLGEPRVSRLEAGGWKRHSLHYSLIQADRLEGTWGYLVILGKLLANQRA
jgi:hypothetical protein